MGTVERCTKQRTQTYFQAPLPPIVQNSDYMHRDENEEIPNPLKIVGITLSLNVHEFRNQARTYLYAFSTLQPPTHLNTTNNINGGGGTYIALDASNIVLSTKAKKKKIKLVFIVSRNCIPY